MALNPVITQACAPRHTSRPTGRFVRRSARAAARIAPLREFDDLDLELSVAEPLEPTGPALWLGTLPAQSIGRQAAGKSIEPVLDGSRRLRCAAVHDVHHRLHRTGHAVDLRHLAGEVAPPIQVHREWAGLGWRVEAGGGCGGGHRRDRRRRRLGVALWVPRALRAGSDALSAATVGFGASDASASWLATGVDTDPAVASQPTRTVSRPRATHARSGRVLAERRRMAYPYHEAGLLRRWR